MITNINSPCTFVLTETGAGWWNNSFLDVPARYRPEPKKAGDTVRSQLWVVMQVFGPHIHLGMSGTFFENNNLDIPPC